MEKEMIKAVRLYMNKTQQEFADFLGVSISYIGRVETGDLSVSPKLKAKILSKFDINDHFLDFFEKLRRLS